MTKSQTKRHKRVYGSTLGIALFLLLPLGGYALLNVYPSLLSIYYSLNEYSGVGQLRFVGLRNFANMIDDPIVHTAVVNGLRNLFLVLAVQVPAGFFLAFLLSRARGSKVFVLFYFLPVIISEVVLALMWRFILNSQWGLLNSVLRSIGLESLALKWLSDPELAPWAVLAPGVWQWIGFNVVLFLAAIQGLPQELFDAAKIDGASGWQEFACHAAYAAQSVCYGYHSCHRRIDGRAAGISPVTHPGRSIPGLSNAIVIHLRARLSSPGRASWVRTLVGLCLCHRVVEFCAYIDPQRACLALPAQRGC
jgi:ABC-type sugar transport system permease subunit